MDLKDLMPVLVLALPVLGKLLLMVPFVPNKLIPWILRAFAIAKNYWFLLGFPADAVTGTGGGSAHFAYLGLALGGLGKGLLSVVWGWGE